MFGISYKKNSNRLEVFEWFKMNAHNVGGIWLAWITMQKCQHFPEVVNMIKSSNTKDWSNKHSVRFSSVNVESWA